MEYIKLKIRKGDTVKVLTGKDKGKTGKVLEVVSKSGRVLVEGINMVTRHQRPKTAQAKGQKISKPAGLDMSNVQLVCSNCGKTTRVTNNVSDNGDKSRICKHCNKAQ